MAVLRFLLYIAFLFFLTLTDNAGASEKYSDDQVKAVFIYNFLNFIEWPQSKESMDSISVCVLGDTQTAKYLSVFEGEKVRNKAIRILKIKSVHGSEKCNVVFLSDSEQNKTKELISNIKNYPVLSISGIDDFTANGGIIEFVEEGSRIKFKINLKAAQRSGLTVSSRLLRIAYVVGEK